MKSYPKVWRHDHPLIENLLSEGTVTLLEKLDGSNFRFLLYDARFAETYDDFDGVDPSDGDIVFGSKNRWRGTLDTPLDELDGNFWRAVRHLRDTLDIEAIRALHDEYGPLVFFAENMVRHTLDYDWETVPPLIGFDVYAAREDEGSDVPFEGFLSVDEVFEAFDRINLAHAPALDQNISVTEFDPDDYEVPSSRWRDGRAEGVVIRNDEVGERGKLVTDEFRETMAKRWGKRKDEAEDDTELLVATYCTNARIRKNVHKLVRDEGHEFEKSIIEPLYKRVVRDIWEEEWADIIEQNWTIEMRRIWPLVAQRCEEVVETMLINSELNDAPPEKLWEDIAQADNN